jgi:hypothetical protein
MTRNLAMLPAQGPTYLKLIQELKLVEGAARQVQFAREDARWGMFAYEMNRFHERIGDAIRSHKAREIFMRMAEMMEFCLARCEELRTAATGRRGMILPKPQPGPHRETRPVHITRPSGLIVPDGVTLH